MKILRSVAPTTVAATSKELHLILSIDLGFHSVTPIRLGLSKSFTSPLSALQMDTHKSSAQVVRILGSTPVKSLEEASKQTGFKARLIGQGVTEDFLISAAVSEFKGSDVFGVICFAQVSMELARIEADFSGLSPGKHGWSINDFVDLTRGVASTGKIYNPINRASDAKPVGDLGTLDAFAFAFRLCLQCSSSVLCVLSIAIYETEGWSDSGVSAAVIARRASVGENYKKLCTCDGTTHLGGN